MTNQNDFKWIKNNQQQLKWLISYLDKKIQLTYMPEPFNENTIKQIEIDVRAAKHGDGLELFLKKSRSAWNQYKRRLNMKSSHVTSTIELKKPVYKRVNKIAINYNIPVSLAIEELLINSCDFVESQLNKEKMIKRLTFDRKAINQKRKRQFELLSRIKPVVNAKSTNELLELLSKEMMERHFLELANIQLISCENLNEIALQNKEKERYFNECNINGITCLYDNLED